MNTASCLPVRPRLSRWSGPFLVALFLVAAGAAPAQAAGPAPAPGPRTVCLVQRPRASVPVPTASIWHSVNRFLESSLNNRRRMLQFATVGMCLALYIMIWRR